MIDKEKHEDLTKEVDIIINKLKLEDNILISYHKMFFEGDYYFDFFPSK